MVHELPNRPDHPETLSSPPFIVSPLLLKDPTTPSISPLLFGGFLEHLGRCIYGGIVDDPKDPSPPSLLVEQEKGRLGWRKDVMEVLRDELEVPMLRWPGGNFVSNYHWQDGIGPIDQRPKRLELAWLSNESNLFGTDEFIDYCRAVKAEPFICLNMGTGTLEEALAWVEYCNGTGDTHWANLRRKNTGRDEPHAVKYWGLGNEMYGVWQVGNLKQTDYAKAARVWAHGCRLVDPSMELISCGWSGGHDWDREVLETIGDMVEHHSIHMYSMNYIGEPAGKGKDFLYEWNVFGPEAAASNIDTCQQLIHLAELERVRKGMPKNEIKIAFDEWNVWDHEKGVASNGLEQIYDYTDMLGMCAWLNVLMRKHEVLGMACIAQSVNVISPVIATSKGIIYQTTYHPLYLVSKHMRGGKLLQLPSMPDAYIGPTLPTFIQVANLRPRYVDIIGVIVPSSGKGSDKLVFSMLNRHPTADVDLPMEMRDFEVESVTVHEIYGDNLGAMNTAETPDAVKPKTRTLSKNECEGLKKASGSGTFIKVRKHSWCMLIVEGKVSGT